MLMMWFIKACPDDFTVQCEGITWGSRKNAWAECKGLSILDDTVRGIWMDLIWKLKGKIDIQKWMG